MDGRRLFNCYHNTAHPSRPKQFEVEVSKAVSQAFLALIGLLMGVRSGLNNVLIKMISGHYTNKYPSGPTGWIKHTLRIAFLTGTY